MEPLENPIDKRGAVGGMCIVGGIGVAVLLEASATLILLLLGGVDRITGNRLTGLSHWWLHGPMGYFFYGALVFGFGGLLAAPFAEWKWGKR